MPLSGLIRPEKKKREKEKEKNKRCGCLLVSVRLRRVPTIFTFKKQWWMTSALALDETDHTDHTAVQQTCIDYTAGNRHAYITLRATDTPITLLCNRHASITLLCNRHAPRHSIDRPTASARTCHGLELHWRHLREELLVSGLLQHGFVRVPPRPL